MTRRERLERKLEKRQDWAAGRKAKAAAAFKASSDLVAGIPMGQPILVGHHSEKHHRRTLARSDAAMSRGWESQNMAEHHAAKAAGLERQLARCIFSDDADALERLQEKIAKEEALRDRMKAANAIIRRKPKNEATPEKMAELTGLGLTETHARQLFTPDCCGRIGFAAYELTNLGANIRRLRERMETITKDQARHAAAEAADEDPDRWQLARARSSTLQQLRLF